MLSEAAIDSHDTATLNAIKSDLGTGKDSATQSANQALLINDNLKLIQALDDHPGEFDYKTEQLPKKFVTVTPTYNSKDAKVLTVALELLTPLGSVIDFAEAKSAGDYFFAALGIAPGEKILSGAFKAYQEAKALGDVEGMVKAVNDAKIFTKGQYQAPANGTGNLYTVYQRDIDMDTLFTYTNNRGKVVQTTNRDLMADGKTPFVKDANGNMVQVNLHHSQQQGNGPLFEVTSTTHQASENQNVLHPYKQSGDGQNPTDPVDRASFDKDRNAYWKARANSDKGGQ